MKRRRWVLVVGVVLALAGLAGAAWAEVKFDYGASARLRQEIWDDVTGLGVLTTGGNADRNFFRLRLSAWGNLTFEKDYSFYTKLTTEPKYHLGPFKPNGTRNNDRIEEDELLFDNLYFDAKNVGGIPVDARIGRQDFLGVFGEGFLITDGTPGDGSRTFYFNAAKVTWRISQNHNIDFAFITDRSRDYYLPSLYPNEKRLLNISDELAFLVYNRNKIDAFVLEPYYIYKREQNFGTTPTLDLNTLGFRALYSANQWNAGAEFAYQFGDYKDGRDREGYGGYAFVGRSYPDVALKPEWEFRFVHLSGDDPGTAKNEGWDPLFSRNPYWNELIIYTMVDEQIANGGALPGYWSNIQLFILKLKGYFSPQTSLALSYQYLRAPEKTAGLNAVKYSNDGKERGHLPTALLNHKFSKNVDGYLQFEYFIPGSFYADNADNAIFFRWQLQFKI